MNDKKEIKYFSMFTGVGGFELGIERANDLSKTARDKSRGGEEDSRGDKSVPMATQQFTCVGFSEIDKYASELLKNKFPTVKNYGDATKLIPKQLPDFELLVSGFPCQAFSIAGKRKGFEDTRGTLFHDIVRVLEIKKPIYLLLENVKGLLSHDRGRTFAIILASLSKLGYVIQWMVLNSKFFGVPQNRERVFIIGSLRGFRIPEILPFRESKELLDESGEKRKIEGESSAITKNYHRGVHSGGETYIIHNIYGGFGEDKVRKFTEYSPTIRTPKGGGHLPMVKQDMKIRRLTPTECERLQGFPDGWTEGFSDTQRYKMMGNAVTVNVVEAIARRLI